MEVLEWAAAYRDEVRKVEIDDDPRLLGARHGERLAGKTHGRAVLVGCR